MSGIVELDVQDVTDMTVPTSDELAAQVRVSKRRFLAIAKNGPPLAHDARTVEDGMAIRPWGQEDSEWRWTRIGDFTENFEIFSLVDTQAYLDVIVFLKDKVRTAVKCMGKSSRRRWNKL